MASDHPRLQERRSWTRPSVVVAPLAALTCALYLAYSLPNWIGALLAALLGAPVGLLVARRARDRGPAGSPSGRLRQLVPAELSPPSDLFVGRERELTQMTEWFEAEPAHTPRTISLYGPPGIGKTTLATRFAIQHAGEFPDGQLLARVRPDDHPGEAWKNILAGFVDSLLDPEADRPGTPAELMRSFRELTENRVILVVLDDVHDDVLLPPLIPAGPQCLTILVGRDRVTSVPVGLAVELEPLAPSDSLALLEHAMGDDRATTNRDAATTIVEKSDNLPIAVSLTGNALAGRPFWDLDLAVERLHASAPKDAPGALDLLFGLLTVEEQQAFLRLGLLRTTVFSPWMLEAVGGTESEAEASRTAKRLADVGLVERMPPDGAGIASYRMLDHVHEYARRRATADRRLDGVRRTIDARLEHARRERDKRARTTDLNLRSEVYRQKDRGDLDQAFLTTLGAVTLTQEAGQDKLHALALATLAELNTDLCRSDVGLDRVESAREADDPHVVARTQRAHALIARRNRQIPQAVRAFDHALAALGPAAAATEFADRERVRTLRERAVACAFDTAKPSRGLLDIDAAERIISRRPEFEPQFRAGIEWARGTVLDHADRHDDAIDALESGLVAARAAGQRLWEAWLQHALARVAAELQRGPDCRHHADAALELFVGMRHRYGIGHSRLLLGRADLLTGAPGTAAARFEETLETLTGCGDRYLVAETYLQLGEATRGTHSPAEARTMFRRAEAMFRAIGATYAAQVARQQAEDEPTDDPTHVTGTYG